MNHQADEEMDDHSLLKGVVGLNISETTGDHDDDQQAIINWAEKLLNSCAAAITSGDFTRVQHLLYVLHELGSLTGDANQRLAAYGLRALTLHLCPESSSATSSSISAGASSEPVITLSSAESNFFQQSLRQFNEVSPRFTFHNNLANSSILQILADQESHHVPKPTLHIVDVGLSHVAQWAPTLLERLNHRPSGPPPLVRISFISGTIAENNHNSDTVVPFSVGSDGDRDFSTRLLAFAKSINVNLQVNQLDNNHPLQSINSSPDETLIVCTQFRLHQYLNHNTSLNERNEFLKALRNTEPKGVILSENNAEYCSCNNCVDFATGFSRRVDYLWKFLDSTSSAFKDRVLSGERRLMEEEAAKALTNQSDMNEGKEKWCERMRGAGFVGEVFGEEAIDGAQALLRKYDHNWEMRVDEQDGCVQLSWKGQAVSFCSLWKLVDVNDNDS